MRALLTVALMALLAPAAGHAADDLLAAYEAARQNDPLYRDYFRWSPTNPGETGPWGQDVWHWDSSGW